MDKAFTSYQIAERSYVAYLKREIHSEVSKLNFSEVRVGEIDIIVSEICSNLIKHSSGGEVLYRSMQDEAEATFEIIAVDNGPGIHDVAGMMKDGVSTANTLGHGLGAIERLSSLFQLYSLPGWGTVLYSKVSTQEPRFIRKMPMELDVKALCVPKPREQFCGDGCIVKREGGKVKILFGDGLGHGEFAHEAMKVAEEIFMDSQEEGPVDLLRLLHEKMRRTRGMVATIAVADAGNGEWTICGVGNILTRVYTGVAYKNYMSYNGAVGLNIPKSMNQTTYTMEKNQHLVMVSDGIRSRWDLLRYGSILKHDSMVFASALYKDFSRGTDDASVLIAKVN